MKWKTVKLGEVGEIVTGKTPSTKNPAFYDHGDILFIGPSDLNSCTKHILSSEKHITLEGRQSLGKNVIPRGAICVSCIGTIGYIGVSSSDCATNQQINSIVVKEGINPDYVYYCMKNMWHVFKSLEGQSTTLSILNKSHFSNLELSLPPIETQRRIAAILSSLDDKIENNNRINRNLEAQAQALFKSWFIDFEPFGGVMPEDWRIGTLSEIGDIIGGSTPSKAREDYYTDNGIAWLTPKDLSISKAKFTAKGEIDITKEGYASCSAKIMPRGSVIFSSRAPIGYITIAKNEICTNQGFKSVVPKLAGTAFIYCYLKYATPEIENKATGSTFKEASGSLMKSLQLTIPSKEVLDAFENSIYPLFNEQERLEDESRRLATLRDTLLPKLMKGSIAVA